MKLTNALYKLYADPWVIVPSMHRTLCEIVRDHVTGLAHAPGGRAAAWPEQAAPAPAAGGAPADGVARIDVVGVMARRLDELAKSSGCLDLLDVSAALRAAVGSPDVGGILLVFDSPGGAVGGVPELASEIREAAKVKPVVALASGLMASGAYWLGSQATAVFMEPSGQVGSIGVYQAFLDESRNYAAEGLHVDLFATGKFKGMGIRGLPLTGEQRAYMQARVDEVFGWFRADVARNRAAPEEAMDGRVFFAREALALDLVDAVGDEAAALAELRALMGR